ncbi:MAG: YfhO family protein [Candidatus Goldiibacteriota bacterium]
MNKKKRAPALIGGGFVLISLILFKDAFSEGNMLFGHDTLNIYLPFKIFASNIFREYGALPVWMPNIFGGIPLLASSSLLYYYPTDLLFMFSGIEPYKTYTPDMIIHMFLAGWGMYLFIRQIKASKEAAVLGAVMFMLSGFIISFIAVGHWNNIKAGALIPFTFYFTLRGLNEKKLFWFASAGCIFALQVLATGMQVTAYNFMGVSLLFLYKGIITEKETRARLINTAMFAAGGIFILWMSAGQFFPSMEYKDFSWRGAFGYEDFVSWSFHPAELTGFLLPHYFGLEGGTYWGYMNFNLTTYYFGIIAFLLLPFAFMKNDRKETAVFFLVSAVIMLLFSFGGFTPLYKLLYNIPVFNQFRNPGRFIYVFTFFTVAMAAVGFDNIIRSEKEKTLKYLKYTAAAAGVLFIIFLIITSKDLIASYYQSIKGSALPDNLLMALGEMHRADLAVYFVMVVFFAGVIYAFSSGKIKSVFILVCIMCAGVFFDTYRLNSKFINYINYSKFVPAQSVFTNVFKKDRTAYRIADFNGIWGPNRGIYYGEETINGTHGLMPSAYIELLNNNAFNNLNFNRGFNIKYYILPDGPPIEGLAQVKRFSREAENFRILKDEAELGRGYLALKIIPVNSGKMVLRMIKQGIFEYGAVYPSEKDWKSAAVFEDPGTAVHKKYTPAESVFEINSQKENLFVFAESYYNKWKAQVNGREAEILKVNTAAMAVKVPAGKSTVRFYYDDTGEKFWLFVMLFGLVLYILLYITEIKKKLFSVKRRKNSESTDSNTDV